MALNMRNTVAEVSFEALTANTEKAIAWDEKDDHTVLVVNASSETDLTVKAGNGIQGVNDLKLNIPEGVSLIKLESGRFKNVSGANKGKIIVISTGTPGVGVVALV